MLPAALLLLWALLLSSIEPPGCWVFGPGVLVGGGARCPGLRERLQRELRPLMLEPYDVEVVAPREPEPPPAAAAAARAKGGGASGGAEQFISFSFHVSEASVKLLRHADGVTADDAALASESWLMRLARDAALWLLRARSGRRGAEQRHPRAERIV